MNLSRSHQLLVWATLGRCRHQVGGLAAFVGLMIALSALSLGMAVLLTPVLLTTVWFWLVVVLGVVVMALQTAPSLLCDEQEFAP